MPLHSGKKIREDGDSRVGESVDGEAWWRRECKEEMRQCEVEDRRWDEDEKCRGDEWCIE